MQAKDIRILVVDDEPDLRALMKITLENLGYEVLTCGNGEDAINLAFTEYPSLIFLDVVMPGMSGFEVCKYLKNDRKTKDIFIVLVSVLSREVDFNLSIDVGADDYITKPIRVETMVKVLRNTVNPFQDLKKWGLEKKVN